MRRLFTYAGLCILLALPAYAQTDAPQGEEAQAEDEAPPPPPKPEEIAAAAKAISDIASDPQKLEGYCAINKEMWAIEEGQEDKMAELDTKMFEYMEGLGEEYAQAWETIAVADPETAEAAELNTAFEALEAKCQQ